jgi:hypothetical protein
VTGGYGRTSAGAAAAFRIRLHGFPVLRRPAFSAKRSRLAVVVRWRTLLVSLGCIFAASPALAGAAIPPPSLVAHSDDLPGFTATKIKLRSATSVTRYVRVVLGESGGEARTEVAKLKRKGFREGVQEFVSSQQGEALSTAVVFSSPRVAKQELKTSVAEGIKGQGKAVISRFTVAAIPGSFGFSATEAGHSGGAANVFFSTGRCFLLVGNSLHTATQEQLSVAPVAAATAVYQRVKSLCA